jgi:LacI family transcriptional regulator
LTQQHRIAVVIPDGLSAYGSGVAKGIADYARAQGRWRLFALIGQDGNINAPRQLSADAAVVWRDNCNMLPRGIPCVYVGSGCGTPADGRICGDNHAIGAMVADHLLERGLQHFSFVGPDPVHPRCLGYRERIQQAGAHYIETPADIGLNLTLLNADWDIDLDHLGRWIALLPKPVGLMAHNDVTARRVVAACRQAECLVPEQVAIVGVDNNDLICELSDPTLSSVDRAARQTGQRAAALLAGMLQGQPPPPQPIIVPPLGIVVRRSSDMLAIDDVEVAAALRFIREHSHEPIGIDSILQAVPVSRRSLERRFRRLVGRSMHAEIQRVRIDRARDLLARTSLPVPRVAAGCGFNSPEHFTTTFRSATGFTPTAYRARSRVA